MAEILAQAEVAKNHVLQENATTVEKRGTRVLIVGNRKRMPIKGRQIIEQEGGEGIASTDNYK